MSEFRGPCPRCGNLLTEYARRCEGCGALTGLAPRVIRAPRPRTPRLAPRLTYGAPPAPRAVEVKAGRYVVRECEGYPITFPIRQPGTEVLPGIECVVLDTAWNYRQVAAFTSQGLPTKIGRAAMFQRTREAAAQRCAELNGRA